MTVNKTKNSENNSNTIEHEVPSSIARIAGGAAHDLNNILGGIVGYISILKAKTSKNDDIFPVLEMIEKNGDRATKIISQLVDYANNADFNLKPLDLNDLLQQISATLSAYMGNSVNISYNLADDLPQIIASQSSVTQIIKNLVLSAAQTIPHGDLAFSTTIIKVQKNLPDYIKEKKQKFIYLSIIMTRAGLDINDEIDNNKDFNDTGLNVAIVRELARSSNSYFFIDSKSYSEILFSLYFPVSKDTGKKETKNDKKNLIMVVDNETILLRMIKDCFELLGYKGVFVPSGKQAIDIFKKRNKEIKLVMLDLFMPEINGEDVLKELRKVDPTVQILITSGFAHEQKNDLIEKYGIKYFLNKPFKIKTLDSKLKYIFNR